MGRGGFSLVVAIFGAAALAGLGSCGEADPCASPDPESLTSDPFYFDADGDGFRPCTEPADCDDADPRISPERPEECDGIDNDCDQEVDEGFDTDGDGVLSCAGDCANADPSVHAGAEEVCDGIDTDCDPATTLSGDEDLDQDGHPACGGDCDDADPGVNPAVASDVCDGVDEDCDEAVDEDANFFSWWPDADGDGAGDPAGEPVQACSSAFLPGDVDRVANDDDCDDADPENFPGNEEACDGRDNDCDLALGPDEVDADGDGVMACAGDCDDADASTYPGAPELCDGADHDCDGGPGDADADGDGVAPCAGDCDDADPEVHPGATDAEGDGIDQDCDGVAL